jgi:hypothetical protein
MDAHKVKSKVFMNYKHEGINADVRENKLRVKASDVTTESDE